jgi:hypothetical protein
MLNRFITNQIISGIDFMVLRFCRRGYTSRAPFLLLLVDGLYYNNTLSIHFKGNGNGAPTQ